MSSLGKVSGSDTLAANTATLKEQAALSRQMRFPNHATEKAYIGDFDHRLTQTVRRTESILLDQARTMSAQLDELITAANEATRVLREMQLDFMDDSEVDLDAWTSTDNAIARISDAAAKYPARIEALNERLDDVLGYVTALQERYPALNRPNLLPMTSITDV